MPSTNISPPSKSKPKNKNQNTMSSSLSHPGISPRRLPPIASSSLSLSPIPSSPLSPPSLPLPLSLFTDTITKDILTRQSSVFTSISRYYLKYNGGQIHWKEVIPLCEMIQCGMDKIKQMNNEEREEKVQNDNNNNNTNDNAHIASSTSRPSSSMSSTSSSSSSSSLSISIPPSLPLSPLQSLFLAPIRSSLSLLRIPSSISSRSSYDFYTHHDIIISVIGKYLIQWIGWGVEEITMDVMGILDHMIEEGVKYIQHKHLQNQQNNSTSSSVSDINDNDNDFDLPDHPPSPPSIPSPPSLYWHNDHFIRSVLVPSQFVPSFISSIPLLISTYHLNNYCENKNPLSSSSSILNSMLSILYHTSTHPLLLSYTHYISLYSHDYLSSLSSLLFYSHDIISLYSRRMKEGYTEGEYSRENKIIMRKIEMVIQIIANVWKEVEKGGEGSRGKGKEEEEEEKKKMYEIKNDILRILFGLSSSSPSPSSSSSTSFSHPPPPNIFSSFLTLLLSLLPSPSPHHKQFRNTILTLIYNVLSLSPSSALCHSAEYQKGITTLMVSMVDQSFLSLLLYNIVESKGVKISHYQSSLPSSHSDHENTNIATNTTTTAAPSASTLAFSLLSPTTSFHFSHSSTFIISPSRQSLLIESMQSTTEWDEYMVIMGWKLVGRMSNIIEERRRRRGYRESDGNDGSENGDENIRERLIIPFNDEVTTASFYHYLLTVVETPMYDSQSYHTFYSQLYQNNSNNSEFSHDMKISECVILYLDKKWGRAGKAKLVHLAVEAVDTIIQMISPNITYHGSSAIARDDDSIPPLPVHLCVRYHLLHRLFYYLHLLRTIIENGPPDIPRTDYKYLQGKIIHLLSIFTSLLPLPSPSLPLIRQHPKSLRLSPSSFTFLFSIYRDKERYSKESRVIVLVGMKEMTKWRGEERRKSKGNLKGKGKEQEGEEVADYNDHSFDESCNHPTIHSISFTDSLDSIPPLSPSPSSTPSFSLHRNLISFRRANGISFCVETLKSLSSLISTEGNESLYEEKGEDVNDDVGMAGRDESDAHHVKYGDVSSHVIDTSPLSHLTVILQILIQILLPPLSPSSLSSSSSSEILEFFSSNCQRFVLQNGLQIIMDLIVRTSPSTISSASFSSPTVPSYSPSPLLSLHLLLLSFFNSFLTLLTTPPLCFSSLHHFSVVENSLRQWRKIALEKVWIPIIWEGNEEIKKEMSNRKEEMMTERKRNERKESEEEKEGQKKRREERREARRIRREERENRRKKKEEERKKMKTPTHIERTMEEEDGNAPLNAADEDDSFVLESDTPAYSSSDDTEVEECQSKMKEIPLFHITFPPLSSLEFPIPPSIDTNTFSPVPLTYNGNDDGDHRAVGLPMQSIDMVDNMREILFHIMGKINILCPIEKEGSQEKRVVGGEKHNSEENQSSSLMSFFSTLSLIPHSSLTPMQYYHLIQCHSYPFYSSYTTLLSLYRNNYAHALPKDQVSMLLSIDNFQHFLSYIHHPLYQTILLYQYNLITLASFKEFTQGEMKDIMEYSKKMKIKWEEEERKKKNSGRGAGGIRNVGTSSSSTSVVERMKMINELERNGGQSLNMSGGDGSPSSLPHSRFQRVQHQQFQVLSKQITEDLNGESPSTYRFKNKNLKHKNKNFQNISEEKYMDGVVDGNIHGIHDIDEDDDDQDEDDFPIDNEEGEDDEDDDETMEMRVRKDLQNNFTSHSPISIIPHEHERKVTLKRETSTSSSSSSSSSLQAPLHNVNGTVKSTTLSSVSPSSYISDSVLHTSPLTEMMVQQHKIHIEASSSSSPSTHPATSKKNKSSKDNDNKPYNINVS